MCTALCSILGSRRPDAESSRILQRRDALGSIECCIVLLVEGFLGSNLRTWVGTGGRGGEGVAR